MPATKPDGATVIGSPVSGSLPVSHGKYSAPFWLLGMRRPGTASLMTSPIIGSGAPVGSATVSAGASAITNARLRSANASASDCTGGSQTPGVSSRLKTAILSSEPSVANASREVAGAVRGERRRPAVAAFSGAGASGPPTRSGTP